MLKLKLQYFGHLMRRADWLQKTLLLGKIEGSRKRDNRGGDGWMVSLQMALDENVLGADLHDSMFCRGWFPDQ